MFSTALSLIIAGIVIMVERSRYGAYPGADPDKGPDISEICLNLPLVYLKTEKGIDELEHFERQTASIQVGLCNWRYLCLLYTLEGLDT